MTGSRWCAGRQDVSFAVKRGLPKQHRAIEPERTLRLLKNLSARRLSTSTTRTMSRMSTGAYRSCRLACSRNC